MAPKPLLFLAESKCLHRFYAILATIFHKVHWFLAHLLHPQALGPLSSFVALSMHDHWSVITLSVLSITASPTSPSCFEHRCKNRTKCCHLLGAKVKCRIWCKTQIRSNINTLHRERDASKSDFPITTMDLKSKYD